MCDGRESPSGGAGGFPAVAQGPIDARAMASSVGHTHPDQAVQGDLLLTEPLT